MNHFPIAPLPDSLQGLYILHLSLSMCYAVGLLIFAGYTSRKHRLDISLACTIGILPAAYLGVYLFPVALAHASMVYFAPTQWAKVSASIATLMVRIWGE